MKREERREKEKGEGRRKKRDERREKEEERREKGEEKKRREKGERRRDKREEVVGGENYAPKIGTELVSTVIGR
jgi:F0F1-type ATP synthase assembly protein I